MNELPDAFEALVGALAGAADTIGPTGSTRDYAAEANAVLEQLQIKGFRLRHASVDAAERRSLIRTARQQFPCTVIFADATGSELAAARQALNVTRVDLAKESGLSLGTIYNAELSRFAVRSGSATKIVQALVRLGARLEDELRLEAAAETVSTDPMPAGTARPPCTP